MVRTQHFHCQGQGSIPGWGNEIPQAMRHDLKKKKSDVNVFKTVPDMSQVNMEYFTSKLLHSKKMYFFLELTPKKDVLFIRGGWNAKVGSQEIPGVGAGALG